MFSIMQNELKKKILDLIEENELISASSLSIKTKKNYYIVLRLLEQLEKENKIIKKLKTKTFAYWGKK